MIIDWIKKARTIRRFDESQPVDREFLTMLVECARLSPCGGNGQKLRYWLVTGSDECDKVFPLVKWAGALPEWAGPESGQRPTGWIIIVSEVENPAGDVGIAAQSMLLAAAEQGIGCCMMGAIDRPAIKEALGIPDPYEVKLALAFGKVNETVIVDDIHAGDAQKYYRDEKDNHHVPKIVTDDLILNR